jgi:hypothetical protein
MPWTDLVPVTKTRAKIWEYINSLIGNTEYNKTGGGVGYSIKVVTYSDSPYTISDSETYSLYLFDTTSGNIIFNFPTLDDNYGKNFKCKHLIQGSSNYVSLVPEGVDDFTRDQLSSLQLAKEGDRINLFGCEESDTWEILDESISCVVAFDTHLGFGSVDTAIERFTNITYNYGNLLSENHSSGYNGNTEGLEVTVLKSGKYNITYLTATSTSGGGDGQQAICVNSTSLTTSPSGQTNSVRKALKVTNDIEGNVGTISWCGRLEKDDIIRAHMFPYSPYVPIAQFLVDYIGKGK